MSAMCAHGLWSLNAFLQYRVLVIPRARQVHQPLITTPLTTSYALLYCVYYITLVPLWALLHGSPASLQSDVLILNGPGTCFVLAAAVYLNKVSKTHWPRGVLVIYLPSSSVYPRRRSSTWRPSHVCGRSHYPANCSIILLTGMCRLPTSLLFDDLTPRLGSSYSGLVAYPLVREVTVLVGWSKALPLSLTTLLESGRVSFPRVMMARTRDVLSVLPPLPKEAS